MRWRDQPEAQRKSVVSIALTASLMMCLPVLAGDSAIENAQLAQLLRQLDLLDRTAHQASIGASRDTRYRFDYARLHADIARVRAGIEDYLTPPRAQPRDPTSLNGEYRIERGPSP